jgi:hypothetical protein
MNLGQMKAVFSELNGQALALVPFILELPVINTNFVHTSDSVPLIATKTWNYPRFQRTCRHSERESNLIDRRRFSALVKCETDRLLIGVCVGPQCEIETTDMSRKKVVESPNSP